MANSVFYNVLYLKKITRFGHYIYVTLTPIKNNNLYNCFYFIQNDEITHIQGLMLSNDEVLMREDLGKSITVAYNPQVKLISTWELDLVKHNLLYDERKT